MIIWLKKKRRKSLSLISHLGFAQSVVQGWQSTKIDTHVASAVIRSGKEQKRRLIPLERMKKNRKIKNYNNKFKAISYSLFYILLFSFTLLLILYFYSYITVTTADISTTVAFSFLLPALAFAYLAHSGKSVREALLDLGIVQTLKVMRILGISIMLFLAVFIMELIITVMSLNFNLNIETNACNVVMGMPFWFILFVVFIGPINEELFFRGFLVKRIGIILSALLFAILHAGYGSTFGIDIIAAFIFGIIAGYIFKKTNSIYPTLLAHAFINLIAVLGCI